MAKGIFTSRSAIGGAFFVVVGASAAVMSRSYDMGTVLRMGPGYFPFVLGLILVVLGLGAIVSAFLTERPDAIELRNIRPLIAVFLAVVSFSYLVDKAGLFIATAALLVFACFRGLIDKPLEVLAIYVCLASFSAIVFVDWLGITIPLFWWR
jgi:hypothetical protein